MTDQSLIKHRIDLMKRLIRGRVRILPTSPRWSWLDWKLAHAGPKAALAAIEAHLGGATFTAWRRAIQALDL